MWQILEKRSVDRTGGDRTDVAQDEPDGSIQAESRGVFGASQVQLRSGRSGLRAPFLDGSVSPDQDRRSAGSVAPSLGGVNFERHGEITSLLSRLKGVKISAPELTGERNSFRGWDKAIMTFLKGRTLDGGLLSDANIPVADSAVSIDNLLQSGCSMENVERHHAVWEILVSCLKTMRGKSLLHNAITSPALPAATQAV